MSRNENQIEVALIDQLQKRKTGIGGTSDVGFNMEAPSDKLPLEVGKMPLSPPPLCFLTIHRTCCTINYSGL